MTEPRKAGALILSELAMFNEATILFETVITPEILEQLSIKIEEWAQDNNWDGEFDWEQILENNMFIAPRFWDKREKDEDVPAWMAWFGLWYHEPAETDSYLLADLCRVGQTEFGFWFQVQHKFFGGKSKWNKLCAELPESIGAQLGKLGFTSAGRGEYFLPVRLDAAKLANAWENEDYEDVFLPLMETLKTLKESLTTFDELLVYAQKRLNNNSL